MARLTERGVLDLLAARYVAPAWAFLRHVADGTGANKIRTADGLAMSLWPSRGLELHGFEVKVDRGDWLRELKDPAKADEIASRCHRWWVVAGDDGVVGQGDLFPQAWGLLVVRDGELVMVHEAPLLTPAPLDWTFLAAILRRAAEAQARSVPTQAPRARARGVDPVTDVDARRLRGRLDRLKSTAAKIASDTSMALYDLDRALSRDERDDATGTGGT